MELARNQHGVVGRAQLRELGYSESAIAHAERAGRIERVSRRVHRIRGSAETLEQRAMVAVLDVPGGAVAMHSAAAFWKQPGFTVEPLHVLSGRRPHRGIQRVGQTHSSVRFGEDEVIVLEGIPVTSPLRTLQDLAGRVHPDRLDLVCERMLSKRLIRLEALHQLGSRLPRRGGAPGTRTLRLLIVARPDGYRPAESNLERRFESILAGAGEPPLERQVDLGDDDGWIGRVDYVDRARRLVVEVQSDLFHGGRADRRRDAARIARLERAGWSVVEVFEHEIWYQPHLVLHRIRSARSRTGRA